MLWKMTCYWVLDLVILVVFRWTICHRDCYFSTSSPLSLPHPCLACSPYQPCCSYSSGSTIVCMLLTFLIANFMMFSWNLQSKIVLYRHYRTCEIIVLSVLFSYYDLTESWQYCFLRIRPSWQSRTASYTNAAMIKDCLLICRMKFRWSLNCVVCRTYCY